MTTICGLNLSTNSRACASAVSMSSRRSCDGPGRFSSGLWDIQNRASGTVSSRYQGEDLKERGAHLGCELSDARARDTAIGAQEQHGLLVGVEPSFQVASAVADDHNVWVVVPGPVQLSQRPRRHELGAQRLPVRKRCGTEDFAWVVVPAQHGEPTAQNVIEQDVRVFSGIHPGLHE